MGVQDKGSIHSAVAQLLSPSEEQDQGEELEQEVLEDENLEALDEDLEGVEESDDLDDEDVEVGGSEEEDYLDDDEEEPEQGTEDDTFYKVKVDGEEFEVNLEELRKGYQLEKNYTKKRTQLKAEEDKVAALKTELETERAKYIQGNQLLAQQQASELQKVQEELAQIDKTEDPIGYVQKQLEVQDAANSLAQQQQALQQAQAEQQARNQQVNQAYVAEQQAVLAEQLPEWTSTEKGEALQQEIVTFAKGMGYTDSDLSNIVSARDIIVLNKAKLYDEIVAKRAKVRGKRSPQKAKPVVRAAQSKGASVKKARKVKAKKDQFKRSGSVKDAQALLVEAMSGRNKSK